MTKQEMKNIVEHLVLLSLEERNMTISDIGTKQYKDELYDMAIKLLVELRK